MKCASAGEIDPGAPAGTDGYVLVVDDDEDMRGSLADILAENGFRVVTAAGANEALAMIAVRGKPCLMLLDWTMPDVGGREMLELLAGRKHLADLPVCIATSLPELAMAQAPDVPVIDKARLDAVLGAARRYCRPAVDGLAASEMGARP